MRFTRFSPKTFVQSVRRVPARFRRSLSEYRFYAYFAVLGPGIIAASSGNEVSGIATYSSAGATYGYTLLWTFIPMTVFFIVAQEMCVRMGVVTGQGLADLIREQFGVRWTALVMLALVIEVTPAPTATRATFFQGLRAPTADWIVGSDGSVGEPAAVPLTARNLTAPGLWTVAPITARSR